MSYTCTNFFYTKKHSKRVYYFSIQVWAIKQEEIHCVQVHDVKEAVLELVANNSIVCFAPQGTGVKVSGIYLSSFGKLHSLDFVLHDHHLVADLQLVRCTKAYQLQQNCQMPCHDRR